MTPEEGTKECTKSGCTKSDCLTKCYETLNCTDDCNIHCKVRCRICLRVKGILALIMVAFLLYYVAFATDVVDGTVLKVDLNTHKIVTSVGLNNVKAMVEADGGVAGMNGGYFIPCESAYLKYGDCGTTTMMRVRNGVVHSQYYPDSGVRGMFGFTITGEPLFVQNNLYGDKSYVGNTNQDRLKEIHNGISMRPILIDKGVVVVDNYSSLMDSKMNTVAKKGFICSTEDGKTIYMGFVVGTITTMAYTIKDRYNCYYAINLDAGGSSALYNNGRYIVGPGRNVIDGFVVIKTSEAVSNVGLQEMLYTGYVLTQVDYVIINKLISLGITRAMCEDILDKYSYKGERIIKVFRKIIEML